MANPPPGDDKGGIWRMFQRVRRIDVRETLATQTNEGLPGVTLDETQEAPEYTVSHTVEDGIERVVYKPRNRRFRTPILMQHGMWHGAWCWQPWQALFAGWGWESYAFSLPGHAGSPEQRPIGRCTLDYYLAFLKSEVDRLPRPPVLVGHSMGGALVQWYLKYVGDLPAAVLVASWGAHNMIPDSVLRLILLDPRSAWLSTKALEATPFMRTPQSTARVLITKGGLYSPEELHARVGPESVVVVFQHTPLFWKPPQETGTPMLWLAAEKDAAVGEKCARRSAAFYRARYVLVQDAGHNLMMEPSFHHTAETIHEWLVAQSIE